LFFQHQRIGEEFQGVSLNRLEAIRTPREQLQRCPHPREGQIIAAALPVGARLPPPRPQELRQRYLGAR